MGRYRIASVLFGVVGGAVAVLTMWGGLAWVGAMGAVAVAGAAGVAVGPGPWWARFGRTGGGVALGAATWLAPLLGVVASFVGPFALSVFFITQALRAERAAAPG